MLLAQHQWLEATDERHRYGAMLFEYYALWAASDTMDSFFYWLDSGDGLKVESAGKGSKVITRAMLDAATVKYCVSVLARPGSSLWGGISGVAVRGPQGGSALTLGNLCVRVFWVCRRQRSALSTWRR
jgi:hypothetical protein|eukprot:COSAG01_NODE_6161_length_3816_cov_110.535916_4_plen_128_part_00